MVCLSRMLGLGTVQLRKSCQSGFTWDKQLAMPEVQDAAARQNK